MLLCNKIYYVIQSVTNIHCTKSFVSDRKIKSSIDNSNTHLFSRFCIVVNNLQVFLCNLAAVRPTFFLMPAFPKDRVTSVYRKLCNFATSWTLLPDVPGNEII